MSNFEEKKKYPIYLLPTTMERVDEIHKDNGFESRSEFIERAINFYCGYLTTEKCDDFLPDVLITTLGAKLDTMEDRLANLMFKTAVELSMLLHVVSATNEIDETTLAKLRGMCVEEVKRIHGNISLENALKFQKG